MKNKSLLMLSFVFITICNAQQFSSIARPFKNRNSQQHLLKKSNTKQLPQQTKFYFWESSNNSWEIADTTSTTYNDKGLTTSELKIPAMGGPKALFKYTYDIDNRQTERLQLRWNGTTNSWDSSFLEKTTYDIVGNQEEFMVYAFHLNYGWIAQFGSKSIYTYNTSNLPIQAISQYYDAQSNGYINEGKTLYEYNNEGIMISMTSMRWDINLLEFVNDYRLADIIWYKGSNLIGEGLMASGSEQEWNDTNFKMSRRFLYIYDSHDNLTENVGETYNDSIWIPHYRQKYLLTYTSLGTLTEKIEQYWNDSVWTNNVRFVYSNFIDYTGLGDDNHQNVGLTICPNPFSDKTEISIPSNSTNLEFTLYDIAGKNILNQQFESGRCTIEKANLPSGIYFYTVLDNKKSIATGKLVIY